MLNYLLGALQGVILMTMAVLMLSVAVAPCFADDAVAAKIKVENADLKDRLSQTRGKLQEAVLELAATKSKDEWLRKELANMHYNLGTVFQIQNKDEEAIMEFEMDLAINPDDADAHYNLALIYDKDKNDRKQAIDQYNAYLKIKPNAADTLKVKERLTDLELQQKIWGDPNAAGIGEKQGLGRL